MRISLLLTLSFIWLNATGQKHTFKSVKSITTDINEDGKIDTIILSSSLQGYVNYNRISVSISGLPKKTFRAKGEWTEVDDEFLKSNKNSIDSKWLFLKKTDKHSAILLFGVQDGAGYRSEFSILNIENGDVKMVIDDTGKLNIESPIALTDLNDDHRLDFVYRITFQCDQVLSNGKVCAYSPYFVYTVADNCNLNKPLMKAYNQKYYVFDGYEYSEEIAIFYPDDGSKPRIWRKPKAKR
ncbi:hypothetical protein [Mucilaginibacter sp. L3T2-6]|uniref:hypothetical protein n=1 Tax=Mucilaginibacter sp. L3T2-6 TaxID=3062491 RepID=UPI002675D575|nr:hypothetical protein [Mucilaginibacter sp. L3T2-6]MDO3644591.1 hypothetical protein [Mucilaginibacter sp. L3T2-6]MDV6217037.1 hypothetical protein [Mucilaginibacter sp. L3T2-6]